MTQDLSPRVSYGFSTKTMGSQPQLKYWALLAAIRSVMRACPDDPEVMDALFGELNPTVQGLDGKTRATSRRVKR